MNTELASWVGVDLDGTLAEYGGWQGAESIGPPVEPMLERVKEWLSEGQTPEKSRAKTTVKIQ